MKEQPCATCTKCGFNITAVKVTLINQRCTINYRKANGKGERCKGIYKSKLLPGTWSPCPSCSGAGRGCTNCKESGWISE